MKNCRKVLIIIIWYLDTILHGVLLFGWSSYREILIKENFFLTCNSTASCTQTDYDTQITSISDIFLISVALSCVVQVPLSVLNDFVSFGLCRLIAFFICALSYFILAFSTPDTSYLQFGFVLQIDFS